MKVLLVGGTGEARQLATILADEDGLEVVSSLAGRVQDARLPVGEVRHGGFGGVAGLVDWLREHEADAVVDATHPFAATMTAHAAEAARVVGLPLLVLRRPGWTERPGDDWRWVDTLEDAADLLPTVAGEKVARGRVFLTVGRQGLGVFAGTGLWMLARCVDAPEPRPDWCELILARGPYTYEDELALLKRHRIGVLVTKDSGGEMTSAKLAAARELGIPVVLIRRPELPPGVAVVERADQVVEWLRARR